MALVFTIFVAVVAICNVSMLSRFFSFREKGKLKEQTLRVAELDLNDKAGVSSLLSEISEKYNFDIEIYNSGGNILYTTYGSQMMDYFAVGHPDFDMAHDNNIAIEKSQDLGSGVTFYKAKRFIDNNEYLICRTSLDNGIIAELRVKQELINSSAAIANEFIIIVSVICFIGSIVWVFIFAKRFARPICEMNDITESMAKLEFDRKIKTDRTDEIGQLAGSVNKLSDSLSAALKNLEKINAGLKSEIETERRLYNIQKEFVANVSHELKTPISIISGYAEGLKCDINPQKKTEYCNTIIDESVRMNRLVLSLLELSKYESGRLNPEKQNFDVSIMAADMAERIFAGKDITFINKIEGECIISADPALIEQVLKAYLENAASHTEKNGEVTLKELPTENGVRIELHNTGEQINNSDMEKIWQSFYRADKARSRESGRFGLGLSIVSAIMKMHKRDCGVYNTDNGVCFWFEADKP
ncbi:MAG: HAMP domain-containing protein [Clostridia bacterium]|nr:HAMP domain-containing protein [Clostridia bacterium]